MEGDLTGGDDHDVRKPLGTLWALFKEEGEKEGAIQRERLFRTAPDLAEVEDHRQRWFFLVLSLPGALVEGLPYISFNTPPSKPHLQGEDI